MFFSDASNADVDDLDLINKSQIDYLNVPLYLLYGEYQMQRGKSIFSQISHILLMTRSIPTGCEKMENKM